MTENVLQLTDGYLKDELAAVRERILGTIQADLPIADDVLVYAFGRGGKWVRPRLVMLAHRAAGGADRKAVIIAAAMEMVHLATLLHDDVIDESDERRGRASANMRYGNRTAVLGGLKQLDARNNESGTPWFRKIPVLGFLFRGDDFTRERREFFAFVTPNILHDPVLEAAERYAHDLLDLEWDLPRDYFFEDVTIETTY